MTDWAERATQAGGAAPDGVINARNWADRSVGAFVTQADPSSPVLQAMRKGGLLPRDVPEKAAGALDQAVASLPTDPMTKVRYLAGRRFPNMPIEQAVSRYGIKDNRLFYVDDAGQAYYEESDFEWPTSTENAVSSGKALAGSVGPAMSMAGGTAGGIAGSAGGGPGGGGAGAAAGGAVGDLSRQALAAAITGEEKSVGARAQQALGAAAMEGASQVIGEGAARALGRFGRTPAYDIAARTELGDKARRFGIPLTAAEETGSRELIRRQKILHNTTGGDEAFEAFYRIRNEKVRDAVYRFLDSVSEEADYAVARRGASSAAREAVKGARAEMAAEARPLYEAAEQVTDVDVRPVLDLIEDRMKVASAPVRATLARVRNDLNRTVGRRNEPGVSIRVIDETKKWLDDLIDKAGAKQTSLGKAQKHHLKDVRRALIGVADEASPEYAAARGVYQEGIPTAHAVEGGVVGQMARLDENATLRASNVLFGSLSSRHDVSVARDAFRKAGKDAEWRALVRSHLQQVFEEIPESTSGSIVNLGGAFRRKIYGNARLQSMLGEAMRDMPEQATQIRWLTDVLDATGKALKSESITAFAQQGQKEMAREARPAVASAIETIELWRTPSRVARYLSDLHEGRYAARMADLLTSPDGIKKIKELRKLSPASAGAVIGLSHLLLGATGEAAMSDIIFPRSNAAPGELQANP